MAVLFQGLVTFIPVVKLWYALASVLTSIFNASQK